MPCIKLHQEVFRVTQHGDGDQYFYWGILSTRLLTKALEQFTSPWKEDYTLEGYTFEIKLHFVIFISTLHLIWKKIQKTESSIISAQIYDTHNHL